MEFNPTGDKTLVKEVAVHRNNVRRDMIGAFCDDESLRCQLEVVFIDDRGEIEEGRGSGVTREALSIFWREFFTSLAIGATEKVPAIRHDFQKSEWQSVARILVAGFAETGYFPTGLSRAFVASCLFKEDLLSTEWLLESFHLYIPKFESQSLKRGMSEECEDPSTDEDILEVLSTYKCYRRVDKATMKTIVEELAHQELIQRPRYVANAWQPIVQALKQHKEFKDLSSLAELYQAKVPTPKKVCKLFEAEPGNESERQCFFDHLKRFVRSLDDNLLSGFLQFVTGSNIISVDRIQVSFDANDSALRCPVAHTCGPLLVIPSTYQSYNELSEEFSNIFRQASAWSFSIV